MTRLRRAKYVTSVLCGDGNAWRCPVSMPDAGTPDMTLIFGEPPCAQTAGGKAASSGTQCRYTLLFGIDSKIITCTYRNPIPIICTSSIIGPRNTYCECSPSIDVMCLLKTLTVKWWLLYSTSEISRVEIFLISIQASAADLGRMTLGEFLGQRSKVHVMYTVHLEAHNCSRRHNQT